MLLEHGVMLRKYMLISGSCTERCLSISPSNVALHLILI